MVEFNRVGVRRGFIAKPQSNSNGKNLNAKDAKVYNVAQRRFGDALHLSDECD